MLKLNSNYAKSYLRDNQEQRIKAPNTQRFYPNTNDYDQPKRPIQDTDFRREKFDYKQTNNPNQFKNDYSNKQKSYGYSYQQSTSNYPNQEINPRKDFPDYSRKTRNYEEPLNDIDSNYNYKEISPKTIPSKRNNYAPPSYQFELTSKNEQNYQQDKGFKYSKYTPSPRPAIETTFDKKQYAVKHSRRNEQVKSRLSKQLPYNNREPTKTAYEERQQAAYDNYMNQPNPYETYRNQEQKREPRQDYPSAYKNTRKLQFQTFQKLDDRKPQRQFKNYDQPSQQYSEQLLLSKKRSDEYNPSERLDRPHLHERKEAIKKSIENTPQKNYKGTNLQPGSAQRKNSLIQKSQMLQEKLKKLNMQYPVGGQRERQREKQVNNEQNYQYQRQPITRQNEEAYTRYNPSPAIQAPVPPNRSTSCLRNSFRNVNIAQTQSITAANRNADILRAKSPILDSQNNGEMPNKGEAIQKITKLNEKINERIQSIISNYAKK